MNGGALLRHALRLIARRRGTMLFFAGCLALGIAFLSAVSHLLSAVDDAVARRAREMLAGDLQVSSPRPMNDTERGALTRAVGEKTGRRASESVAMASMLTPLSGHDAPFLIAAKAVDSYYPMRGDLETAPPGRRAEHGTALLERSAALQHGMKVGDLVKLGALQLKIAGLIDKEPDRDFLGFSFAPRLLISSEDLPKAKLLGLGARVRYTWTMALADGEDPDTASRLVKRSLEKDLADAHVSISTYRDGEASIRDGLRRSALFFTALSLAALLLGAAGLRAGLSLFLDAEGPSMSLLRCLGATVGEVEKLYGGICLTAGLLGGGVGAILGWAIAAAGAHAAARFGLELQAPPRASIFAECLVLSGALAWGLSAARVRALVSRPPLDAMRAPPKPPRALVAAGWAAALLVVLFAAWLQSPDGGRRGERSWRRWRRGAGRRRAALSRGALRAAERLSKAAAGLGLSFPARHGLRRLVRRPEESKVMLFTLAGGFALLACVGTAREGFSRALAPSQAVDAPDLFLVDVQPPQEAAARALAERYSRGGATFAPLVRARLTQIDGEALLRGDSRRDDGEKGQERGRTRSREYNLTFSETLNPSETVVKGAFWKPGQGGAEASVEQDFLDRAGLKLGSRLTFDVSGREVDATVTSVRRVEWASMRPNFFVVLPPALISAAPHTLIASLRARDPAASASLRRELSRTLPNISVIDAKGLLDVARRTLSLMLTAVEALAWFCVAVGALVTAGLVALGRGQRTAEGALERALGFRSREAFIADASELLGLGTLSAACGAAAAVGLAWALSRRLEVPLAADWREVSGLVLAALLLPALSGLLAGAPARRAAILDALRRDG